MKSFRNVKLILIYACACIAFAGCKLPWKKSSSSNTGDTSTSDVPSVTPSPTGDPSATPSSDPSPDPSPSASASPSPTSSPSSNPGTLPSPAPDLAVAAGEFHGCAIANGGVQCWGRNSSGELGDNTTTNSTVPVQVSGLTSGATAVTGGANHSCAIVNGGAWCWGYNGYGQLGNGQGVAQGPSVPAQVTGLSSGVTAIAAATYHTCAVVNGGVQCWGANGAGELGTGGGNSTTPVQVQGLGAGSGVTAIATGYDNGGYSCAIVNGGVQCWGGMVGNSGGGSPTPVQVSAFPAGSGVTAIAAGQYHACVVVNGAVKCWGALNTYGQLGNNTTTASATPVQVSGLTSGATAISAGDWHSCAIVNGGVQCWGAAPLGDGVTNSSKVPVQVSGLTSGVTSITSGFKYTCAMVSGGYLQCWGMNTYGQLGINTTALTALPAYVVASWN